MNPPRHRLLRQLLAVMAGFTLAVAAVFSGYTLIFIYEIEDAVFRAQLDDEAAHQQQHYAETGDWAAPRNARVVLHRGADSLPESIRELRAVEPERIEFPGRGNHHYHLRSLAGAAGEPAWLVYDAGEQLVVRPIRDRILGLLAWTALLAAALALFVGYWLARRVTRPLSQLADAVARLDPARLPERWEGGGDDEVGVVASGLGALIARLREFIARERGFTRDASHELRTPLAVIRSASEQLLRQPELGPTALKFAALIRQSTASLEQTVETLLALAREEHEQGPVTAVLLLPLLERAVVDQSSRLDGKAVQVVMHVPTDASLRAPPAALQILLANLVGNAFAHTEAGTVRIGIEDGALCIRNPAPEAALPGEPEPFRKGAGSEGFGLGLAIVHRLCARFGLVLRIEAADGDVVARLALAPSRQAAPRDD